jgi:hypothetical protein
MASRSSSWLTTASARKSSISLPRKTMRSRRRRPMTSPESAPPPTPSDSALHTGGAAAASEAQGLSLRRGCCCRRREEAAQAGARAYGCLTRRAAAAATERGAVALALPGVISVLRGLTGWSGSRRRRRVAATLEKQERQQWIGSGSRQSRWAHCRRQTAKNPHVTKIHSEPLKGPRPVGVIIGLKENALKYKRQSYSRQLKSKGLCSGCNLYY